MLKMGSYLRLVKIQIRERSSYNTSIIRMMKLSTDMRECQELQEALKEDPLRSGNIRNEIQCCYSEHRSLITPHYPLKCEKERIMSGPGKMMLQNDEKTFLCRWWCTFVSVTYILRQQRLAYISLRAQAKGRYAKSNNVTPNDIPAYSPPEQRPVQFDSSECATETPRVEW